jgi:dienelactone hydrolase
MSLRSTALGTALALAALSAHAQVPPEQAREIATRALDQLDAGQYAQVEAMFEAEMAKAVPAATLKSVWESLPAQAGAATGRGEPQFAVQGEIAAVQVPLHHARAELVAKFAINAQGRIVGFLVQPAAQAAAPAVSADAPFEEREFSVGTDARALPGTLAMPKGQGPFPAVALVHGSGPHDRDQTIGPNRPFLDIARGLAARGIAVLRYDKRTKARAQDFAGRDYTIDEETTADAVAAVAALRKADRIDPRRVFVLGHSQGGMLAPRIARQSGEVAGIVLLAAPARPLLDILVEQNQRLAVLDDGRTSDAERAAIDKLKAQVAAARNDPAAKADALPLGLPANYWRSTDTVDPVAEAKQADVPMLVLQGARDIQVVDADWQRWKGGFHGNPKVAFKLYDKLNHLGIAGEGEGSLAEYGTPGKVDAQLIADVAAWIQAR